ncbi:MAG: hypothetical protein ACKN85_00005, partial [Pirellula sp.]
GTTADAAAGVDQRVVSIIARKLDVIHWSTTRPLVERSNLRLEPARMDLRSEEAHRVSTLI